VRFITRWKQNIPHLSVPCVNRTFSSDIKISYNCVYDPLVCVLVESVNIIVIRYPISLLHIAWPGFPGAFPTLPFCLFASAAGICFCIRLCNRGIINSMILRGRSLHVRGTELYFRLGDKTWVFRERELQIQR
jgi:hypothetical protein